MFPTLEGKMDGWMDGWMDELQFYSHFNSISVISGQWLGDCERLCAMEPCLRSKNSASSGALTQGLLDMKASP